MKKVTANITGTITGFEDNVPEQESAAKILLRVEQSANQDTQARTHLALAQPRHYVLVIAGGIDAELHGPVTTGGEQDKLARQIRRNNFRLEYDCIFRLTINDEGAAYVYSFSHGFFGDE